MLIASLAFTTQGQYDGRLIMLGNRLLTSRLTHVFLTVYLSWLRLV